MSAVKKECNSLFLYNVNEIKWQFDYNLYRFLRNCFFLFFVRERERTKYSAGYIENSFLSRITVDPQNRAAVFRRGFAITPPLD